MKRPWMPLYVNDLLDDPNVVKMSLEEFGAYMKLICYNWNQRGIPSDTRVLASMLRVNHRTFSRIWPTLSPLFPEINAGLLGNDRVMNELLSADEKAENYSKSAKERESRTKILGVTDHNKAQQNTTDQKDQTSAAAPLVLSPSEPTKRFDLDAIYNEYPRKIGKTPGLAKLAKQIRTEADYETAMRGVVAFAVAMQSEGRPLEKIPYFSSWVNQGQWRDYADMPATGQRIADRPGYKVPRAHFEETTDEDLTK